MKLLDYFGGFGMSIELKPIAAAVAIAITALTFTPTSVLAGQTVPVYSPEGTH